MLAFNLRMLRGLPNRIHYLINKLERHIFMENVAHRTHKYVMRFLPLQGFLQIVLM